MNWRELDAEACSLARTLSVIGDRWTLMILRDCFLRVRRFEAFRARLGIGRPILADRLARLVADGILDKVPYQDRPVRHEYRLTAKGLDLHPVILSLVHFGDARLAGEAGRPMLHRHRTCGQLFDPVMVCSVCAEPLAPREVEALPGPGARREPQAPKMQSEA